jgi:hypothetical protein
MTVTPLVFLAQIELLIQVGNVESRRVRFSRLQSTPWVELFTTLGVSVEVSSVREVSTANPSATFCAMDEAFTWRPEEARRVAYSQSGGVNIGLEPIL